MKSPSAGSANPTTLADRPASTPTAAGVNHTGGTRPASSSARNWSICSSDNGLGEGGRGMGRSYLVRGNDCSGAATHIDSLPASTLVQSGHRGRRGDLAVALALGDRFRGDRDLPVHAGGHRLAPRGQ